MRRTTSGTFLFLMVVTAAGSVLPLLGGGDGGGQRVAEADLGSVNTYHLDVAARNLILGALGWR